MILAKDVFSEAYGAIRQNRRRTAITVLGMAWGIATVVLLLAYGTGFSTPSSTSSGPMPVCSLWGWWAAGRRCRRAETKLG